LKDIKSSPGKDLLYDHNNHTEVVCYSEVDWAESPSNRRTTFGYCVSIGDNLRFLYGMPSYLISEFMTQTESFTFSLWCSAHVYVGLTYQQREWIQHLLEFPLLVYILSCFILKLLRISHPPTFSASVRIRHLL